MNPSLNASELATYERDGLLFPKRVLSPERAAAYRTEWEAYEARTGGPIKGQYRYKSHLVFPFIDQIIREPAILDLVECVLGPDILVWNTNLYPKEAGDDRFISWHQDSAHWGLNNNRIASVWIALSPATRENGCMAMIPGSHRQGTVAHSDTWDPKNILTRGQTITQEVDETNAVWITLAPGECSLHHVETMHFSPGNTSAERRVGLAVRYITPSARQTHHDVDYATLVRGKDVFGHFLPERAPTASMDEAALAFHAEVADTQGKILLHGTDRVGAKGLAETNTFR